MAEAMEPMKDKEDDNDFEAESAADTIMKAQKHMEDPEMMTRVHAHVGRKMKALTGFKKIKSVKGIKDYANEKFGAKKDDIEKPMKNMINKKEK